MAKGITELESVMPLTVHKSISGHVVLWLEIDLDKVYWKGDYGTGIGDYDEKISFRRQHFIKNRKACAVYRK